MKNITFRQLRVFNAVARHLSFAKAAEALHVSAPAITMQIKDLEAEVGMPLFERQSRKVSLTTSGEYMLVYTRKMLSLLKDAEDAAARLQRIKTGKLTIGMVDTTTYFIPALLNKFLKEHEGIEVALKVGNRLELIQWLQNNEVDIAIMGSPPSEMPTRAEPFAANPLVFVASPEHLLASETGLRAEDLRQQSFIIREPGSGTRSGMEAFFLQARLQPRISMQLQSNDAIKQAVKANLGLSFLSLHTIGLELAAKQLTILDIRDSPVVRAWHVVHALSKLLSPAAEAFRYFVLEHGESYLAEQFGAVLRPRAQ
ncbi:MAG: LysR family transcriptional regulator [Betaproteobacteria bacterium]|nr:LysR family transcriptional regulator [Betaproteobacteria bacterium]